MMHQFKHVQSWGTKELQMPVEPGEPMEPWEPRKLGDEGTADTSGTRRTNGTVGTLGRLIHVVTLDLPLGRNFHRNLFRISV